MSPHSLVNTSLAALIQNFKNYEKHHFQIWALRPSFRFWAVPHWTIIHEGY